MHDFETVKVFTAEEVREVLTSKSAIEAAAERIDPFAFDPKMVGALNGILLDSLEDDRG